jgi:hypothetical protein
MFLNCSPVVYALPVKVCTKCGELKDARQFRKRSGCSTTINVCKQCVVAYQREWQRNNPEKSREKYRKERENPDAIRARRRRHREKDPARTREQDKKYNAIQFAAHREELKERSRIWRERNPDKVAAYRKKYKLRAQTNKHRRRERERYTSAPLTDGDIAAIKVAQTDKRGRLICWACGKPITRTPHLDHWIPLAQGGLNEAGNLHYMHAKCNWSKGAKMPIEIGRLI